MNSRGGIRFLDYSLSCIDLDTGYVTILAARRLTLKYGSDLGQKVVKLNVASLSIKMPGIRDK